MFAPGLVSTAVLRSTRYIFRNHDRCGSVKFEYK